MSGFRKFHVCSLYHESYKNSGSTMAYLGNSGLRLPLRLAFVVGASPSADITRCLISIFSG